MSKKYNKETEKKIKSMNAIHKQGGGNIEKKKKCSKERTIFVL